MKKTEAIERWGEEVVGEACDYYETDFGKYLFQEDVPGGGDDYCASEEDQIKRCTRASRNLKLAAVLDRTMGPDERYGVPFFERFATRRSVTHEYMYGMPVAAYRDKRTNLTREELEFLRGDPGWSYSEHWSTLGKYAEQLFAARDVDCLLETLTRQVLYAQYAVQHKATTAEEALAEIFETLLKARS